MQKDIKDVLWRVQAVKQRQYLPIDTCRQTGGQTHYQSERHLDNLTDKHAEGQVLSYLGLMASGHYLIDSLQCHEGVLCLSRMALSVPQEG
jgi:hypothetical protein